MDHHLHRELAPILDAAWAQIEQESKRTLKRYLAGRRIVDVPSPGASRCLLSAPDILNRSGPADVVLASQPEVKPLVELLCLPRLRPVNIVNENSHVSTVREIVPVPRMMLGSHSNCLA